MSSRASAGHAGTSPAHSKTAASAPKAAAAVPAAKPAWYSLAGLARNRVPIGFVMHMSAMYLLRHHRVAMELLIIPLLWWELARAFPTRRKSTMTYLCLLTLLDIYRFEFINQFPPPEPVAWIFSDFDLFQFYGLRTALITVVGMLAGMSLVDNIIVNYLLVGLTGVIYLLSQFPIEVLITISMAIAGSDCFQYIAGKRFGRTKIVPKISPNKSLEGYITAILICNVVYYYWLADYSVMTPQQGLIYVNGMLLAGILGDLFISWWKRNHFIKDTSTLLMGHGGFLDRLDSHIGAWIWSIGFVSWAGIGSGILFTPMDYEEILVLIPVTWIIILGYFLSRGKED